MARPINTRPSVRVAAPVPESREGLGVHASTNVQAAPVAGGLAMLAQALGVAAQVGTQRKAVKDNEDYEQGKADQTLNKADQERLTRSERYADGVFEVSSLAQYQDAEASVTEWAATNLDHALPADEQIKAVDAQMQAELAELVKDPKARKVVAARYQRFLDSYAGNVVAAQADARVSAAIDTTTTAIYGELGQGATPNWSEHQQRLTAIIGDGSKATKVLINIVAQRAEEVAAAGGDFESVIKAIPTEIVQADGTKLPSPLRSPENAAIIHNARERAKKAFRESQAPIYAKREMDARVRFDTMLRNGEIITRGMVDEYAGELTEAARASYIDQSLQSRARKDQENAIAAEKEEAMRGAYQRGGSFKKAIGLPGGPENLEQAQKLVDGNFRNILPNGSLAGREIVQDPEAIDAVIVKTAQEDLPYTPLKQHLSAVSPATPGFIVKNLPAYTALKNEGLSGLYVDDNAALLYDIAEGAQQVGLDDKAIEQRLATMGDKDTRAYVSREITKAKPETAYEVPVIGEGDGTTASAVNLSYLQGRTRALTAYALENDMSGSDALAFAQRRVRESHVFLPFGGESTIALPKASVRNPEEAAAALTWWHEERMNFYRDKFDMGPDEEIRLVPTPSLGGTRDIHFILEANGELLTDPRTLDELVAEYRVGVPDVDRRKEVEARNRFLRTPNTSPRAQMRPGRE